MDWKDGIDGNCASETEEMIVNNVRAGFLSNKEILDDCMDDIRESYPEEKDKITSDVLAGVIAGCREKYKGDGRQENFLKLKLAFENIRRHGIITQHCAGYILSDGCDDCNELAYMLMDNGVEVTGYCFYTMQDVERLIRFGTGSPLYLAFGNYPDDVTPEEIGQIIVKELESAGFSTEWNNSADTRIAIENMVWDKEYNSEREKG